MSALLLELRLPLPGWVSILHRLSGLFLVLGLLWLTELLNTSLQSPEAFKSVVDLFRSSFPTQVLLLTTTWAYVHHCLAGLRFLALDFSKGVDLRTARLTSIGVLALSVLLVALLGWAMQR